MTHRVEQLTDFLLMLGINNVAFVMFLAGVLYFLPEPMDAVAAPIKPGVIITAPLTPNSP